MMSKLKAEFLGTLWLVLGGCGSAVLAAGFPGVGIGLAGVSLAFGLTVLTMAYALGRISGGHFNPAVTIGLYVAGRFPSNEIFHYICAQVLGAIAGAGILYMIASGQPGFELGGFAASHRGIKTGARARCVGRGAKDWSYFAPQGYYNGLRLNPSQQ